MNHPTSKTERIHSLDSLRAIMMLLGLVLHAALTYNVTDHGSAWSLKDPETTSIFSDYIVFLIHSFRMPIFFLVAGFFGAMLFYERHPRTMIKNRVSRIAYPFIVFLFVLWPIILFAFGYTEAVFDQKENPLSATLAQFSSPSAFLPQATAHLWFLYYLLYFTATTTLLGVLLTKSKQVTHTISKAFSWVFQRPVARIFIFSGLTFVLLSILRTSMVEASVSLLPDFNTFTFYYFFYILGWILYTSKHLLHSMSSYAWLNVVLAIILATAQSLIIQYHETELNPYANATELKILSSLIVWLFVFGITGLFIRYGSRHSKRMRYISDASYWVYLIHLPITAVLPAFIWELPFSALPKFFIVLLLTTFICFGSYHYLVRGTFMGKFLNGKKYALNKQNTRA